MVKEFVREGGSVIFLAMNFAYDITVGQVDNLFNTLGLRWTCDGREWSTYTVNPRNRHIRPSTLQENFTQEAFLLKNVSRFNALYLKEVDREEEDQDWDLDLRPSLSNMPLGIVSTPAAVARMGSDNGVDGGDIAFVGNELDNEALVDLVMAVCGLMWPPCECDQCLYGSDETE